MPDQTALFPVPAPGMPDGFRYQSELISAEEESELAEQISRLPLKPFEFHGYLGNRRVTAFGFRYDYSRRRAETASPIPAFLFPLRNKVARFSGAMPEDFVQVLITEYAPGAGIGWHRDKPQFKDIVGVSLVSPATFRLRQKSATGWRRLSQTIEPRSAYLLSSDVRQQWEHSIPEQKSLRYSITFRSLAKDFADSMLASTKHTDLVRDTGHPP